MDFTFLSPLPTGLDHATNPYAKNTLGSTIIAYTELGQTVNLEGVKMAIIGVEEERGALDNTGCGQAPNAIRAFLYRLTNQHFSKIADLGNIKPGNRPEDSYFALTELCTKLLEEKITPIIIGGGNELAFAQYQAYARLKQTVNLVAIDQNFDLGSAEEAFHSKSYLGKIILQQPNFLFNYSNIGYQSYFVDSDELSLMNQLNFDVYRLGLLHSEVELSEPIIRNADIVTFDISSIRQSDAPGCFNSTPNGFYGEEACQMARYAGMNDKLSSIGFYEVNPSLDVRGQTSHLAAQLIWHFMDGFTQRKNDFPFANEKDYTKYRVMLQDDTYELLFYKSNKSDRWWMEVPYPTDKLLKYERHYWVPCSYNEYEQACNNQMPDRWWKTFQKLS